MKKRLTLVSIAMIVCFTLFGELTVLSAESDKCLEQASEKYSALFEKCQQQDTKAKEKCLRRANLIFEGEKAKCPQDTVVDQCRYGIYRKAVIQVAECQDPKVADPEACEKKADIEAEVAIRKCPPERKKGRK